MKKLGRLLAVAGLGYGAYRWLRGRPRTMAQVKDAIRGVGDAARRGDLAGARTALTGLGEAISRDQSMRQIVDRVQKTMADVGGQMQRAITDVVGPQGEAGSSLRIDAPTAGGVIPVCATLVQAGRLAAERGTTLEIRNLGERLAVQFDQIGGQLREFGKDVPQGPDEAGRKLIGSLSDLAGNLFDQAFLDETMNAVIRILDSLPALKTGLGTQLRQLQADIQRLGEQSVHRRAMALPGPGTTEGVETDRGLV
jgi:hypothetical protein